MYGLDFDTIVTLCKYFAAHINVPKEKLEKYHDHVSDIEWSAKSPKIDHEEQGIFF